MQYYSGYYEIDIDTAGVELKLDINLHSSLLHTQALGLEPGCGLAAHYNHTVQ